MDGAAIPPDVTAGAVAAVKAYLRIEGEGARADETGALTRAAESAVMLAEAYLGRVLIARDFVQVIGGTDGYGGDYGGGWTVLAASPVSAVTGVPVGDGYAVDLEVDGTAKVRTPAGSAKIAVSYRAGTAADWAAVPGAVAQGIVMLAAHLFEDRSDAVPPAAVAALWRPWRRMRLGSAA